MAPIQNLQELLRFLEKNRSFSLDKEFALSPNIASFLKSVPEKKLPVTVLKYETDNPADPKKITVSGRLDPAPAWAIPQYVGSSLCTEGIELTFTLDTKGIRTALKLSGSELRLGELSFRAEGEFEEPLALRFRLAELPTKPDLLSDLVRVANHGLINDNLPTGTIGEIFTSVSLTTLEVAFGFDQEERTTVLFAAQTGKGLEILRFPDGRSIGIERVGIAVETEYIPFLQDDAIRVGTSFRGHLSAFLTLGKTFEIRISLNGGKNWELTIQPQKGGVLPDLSDLAGMAGGAELQRLVAEGMARMGELTGLEAFLVDRVTVGFDPYGPALKHLAVNSHFLLKVAGRSLRFDSRLRLPDFCIAGELAKGETLDLKGIVTHYFGEVGTFPEVKITALGVALAPANKHYSFHIALENDTELKLSEHITLRLSELETGIECLSGEMSGYVKAYLVIAKDYHFFLGAELAKDQGCLFQGGTVAATEVSLKGFLNDLGRDFGLSVPEELPDLRLSNLLLSFATTAQAELLARTTTAPVDAAARKLSFAGSFALSPKVAADLAFSLTVEEDQNITVACAVTSRSGGALSAFDLLAALFPAEDFQLLKVKEVFDAGLEKVDVTIGKKDGIYGEAKGKVVIGAKLETALGVKREKGKGTGWLFTADFAATAGKTLSLAELLPKELRIIPEELLAVIVRKGNVTLDTGKGSFSFALELDSHLDLGGLGRLETTAFSLMFRKGKDDASSELEITAKGHLKFLELPVAEEDGVNAPVVDLAGVLTLTKGQGSDLSISFEADKGSGRIDIPTLIPGRIIVAAADAVDGKPVIEWVHLLFQPEKIAITTAAGWKFEAKFKLELTNLPEIIDKFLPDEGFEAKLVINKNGAAITLDKLFEIEQQFRIPHLENLPEIDLGTGKISVGKLTATLGKTVGIEATIAFFLPSRLNYIFGEAKDHPLFEIFDTYIPGEECKSLDVTFHARAGGENPDVGVAVTTLPIRQIEKTTIDNEDYWDIKLGRSTTKGRESEYGRILIKVPTFDFDFAKGGFRAEGGFNIKEEPAVPMAPLKQLFTMAGLPKIAETLPPSVPIPLFDPPRLIENGKLNVLGIQAFFRTYLKQELPPPVVDALTLLSSHTVETLPTEFSRYLNPPKLGKLAFRIVITPDGGVDLMFEADPGLRLLFFSPPFFTGVELRSFSFGELFGGQLFSCRIDADFDQYDIVTLASCMLLQDFKQYLGDTGKFRCKLEIKKLWTVFFYQAGFPVPIPLFYDKVGIDYHGPGNIRLQSSFKFPQPEPDLKDIIAMCGDLVRFMTDSGFELKPEKEYKPDLKFTVGPNFIDTGLLLGNRVIGLEQGLPTISAYKTLAYLLNGIKFFSVKKIIHAIDLKYRFGDERIEFFPLSLQVRWLLTTPKEFRERDYECLSLKPEQCDLYLKVLPRSGDEEGVVALFQGVWELKKGEIGRLDTSIGMIAAGTSGFATGLKIEGYLREVLHVKLEGAFLMEMKPPSFQLLIQGKSFLKFAGLEIFESFGMIRIDNRQFRLLGHFRLFKDLPQINIAGDIDGLLDGHGIRLTGSVVASLGPVVLAEARALVLAHEDSPERGVWVEALFLGVLVRFVLEDNRDRLHLAFDAALAPLARVSARLDISKERPALEGELVAEITGFGRLRIDCRNSGAEGALRIEHLGLVIVEGTSRSTPTTFTLSGNFHLFPPGAPLNVIAAANGSFDRSNFALSGVISAVSFLPGIIGGAGLAISNQGVSFGLTFLGVDAGWVKVVDKDGSVLLSFRVGLGPLLFLNPSLSIAKDGRGGSCAISGGIGDLLLDAGLSLGAGARGSYAVRIAGFTLIGGNIWIDQNAFTLDGVINFTVFVINLNGWIKGSGLYLKGSALFGIFPLQLGVEVIIDNGLPAIRIWDALGLLRIRSALMPFRGQLCFLAAWYTWILVVVWIRFCNHLAIGPAGVVSLWLAWNDFPPDWPLVPDSSSLESYLGDAVSFDQKRLLGVVESFLSSSCPVSGGDAPDRERYCEIASVVAGYDFEVRYYPENHVREGSPRVEVILNRTPFAGDFFTSLQAQVAEELQGLGFGSRLEQKGIEQIFNVGTARAVFRRDETGNTQLTLAFLSRGKKKQVRVDYDFADSGGIARHLAEEIRALHGAE